MVHKIFAIGAAAALALSGPATFAQSEDAPATTAADSAEVAAEEVVEAAPVKAKRTYDPISFDMQVDRENILLLDLSTGERVAIRLMPGWAPAHIERIKTLTREGFYDGVIFHRVIDGFMAQTGDPTGTGRGGSLLPDLAEEFNPMPHVRGSVSMARAQTEDSANSQFFIVFYPRFGLDKTYTNFGRVISNMAAVDAIPRGEPPVNPVRILQASLASDNKPVPAPAPAVVKPMEEEITADMLNASS